MTIETRWRDRALGAADALRAIVLSGMRSACAI
jgi:hypothetical protein